MSEVETCSQSEARVSFPRRLMLAGVLLLMTLFFWLQTPEESAVNYIRTFGYYFTAAAFLGFVASVVPRITDYRSGCLRGAWSLSVRG